MATAAAPTSRGPSAEAHPASPGHTTVGRHAEAAVSDAVAESLAESHDTRTRKTAKKRMGLLQEDID